MKKIGLTGGIGTGKSTVGKILSILGFPVFNSDKEAKRIMTDDPTIKKDIQNLLGDHAYMGEELNRAYVAQSIFSDPELKEKLNQIVHPAVRKEFNRFAAKAKTPLVFNEAAILFETGAYKNFDAVILVTADENIRVKRLKGRDGSTDEQIRDRIKNQWEESKKLNLTDYIIYNNENDLLVPQVEKIIGKLL
ncbi:MAG: dephospho-CoA kinase [Brumimicrobium sp.]|nr:dephospho-CoA kinase [Brumimicrobium sp.]